MRRAAPAPDPAGAVPAREAQALHAHQGRLFVLASRRPEPSGGVAGATEAKLVSAGPSQAQLLQVARMLEAPAERIVVELDPASGRELGRHRLPTEAQQVKVVPGRWYWALIEESSAPNMGGGEVTTLALLPASWLEDGRFSECFR
jgi:hypothetical protein